MTNGSTRRRALSFGFLHSDSSHVGLRASTHPTIDRSCRRAVQNLHAVNVHETPDACENPFCSRRIRPGALPFQFPEGDDAARLVDRLASNGWWGQIVGPHGSGKSALLAALTPVIEQTGRDTRLIELHDGQRRLPLSLGSDARVSASTMLLVDGYEQLGRMSRFRLKRTCRRHAAGLLVTAHAPVGLPDLFRTSPELELALDIVGKLTHGYESCVNSRDVAQRFSRHGGNLREMLFDLYDVYEQRRGEE